MDHNCDSFYNSQQRISRFPGLIYAPPLDDKRKKPMIYQVLMTGTPPEKMRWKLDIPNKKSGVVIYIKFPSAKARAILVDEEEIPYNKRVAGEAGQSVPAPIEGKKCGENRYIPVQNVLEFFISGECELEIRPRNAIMTKVKMEWSMEKFFEAGGTTAFVDRLSASLGIHASTIKVVGVSSGSVDVEYEITPTADEPLSLEQIRSKQTEQFATGKIDLGAPVSDVADVSTGVKTIENGVVRAPGFKPIVVFPNDSNIGDSMYVEWIEPFLWEAASIGAVDVPSMLIYEGFWLGLQFMWNGLAGEVNALARSIEKDAADAEQQEKIDNHSVNRVPTDAGPQTQTPSNNDGAT